MSGNPDFFQLDAGLEMAMPLQESLSASNQTSNSFTQNMFDGQISQLPTNTMDESMVQLDATPWMEWSENIDATCQSAQQDGWLDSTVPCQYLPPQPSNNTAALNSANSELLRMVEGFQAEMGNWMSQVEHRVAQVEETVSSLHISLEEEKVKLCDEVNATIERLQTWAGQVKHLVENATGSIDIA